MKTKIRKIQRIIDKLQEIVDEAENREATEVNTNCNTYGLNEYVSLGYDGFLNLDADIDDLIDDPEFDDDMD